MILISKVLVSRGVTLIFAGMLAFSFSCYLYQLTYPPLGDTKGYEMMAEAYAGAGGIVDTPLSNIRTYAYPLFLSVLIGFSSLSGVSFQFLVFSTQTFLYLLLAFILARTITENFSGMVGKTVFVGLLANIFVYPYLAIGLTDSLSVIALLAVALFLAKLLVLDIWHNKIFGILLFFAIGSITGFAIMVRPGNIFLLPISATGLILCLAIPHQNRFRLVGMAFLAAGAGFVLTVLPQLFYNLKHFNHVSIFPFFDLTTFQISSGQKMIKYATGVRLRDLQYQGFSIPYISPWGATADGTIAWYLNHKVIGLKTIGLHIFGALDFDYLFCYIYDNRPWYRSLLFFFSHTAVFWGGLGWLGVSIRWWSSRSDGLTPQRSALLITLLLSFVSVGSWAMVYALTAVENRFALPVFSVLIPFAIWGVGVEASRETLRYKRFVFFAFYLVVAWNLSQWLDSLK